MGPVACMSIPGKAACHNRGQREEVGLAPSVVTLAPPPAYFNEGGSIFLDAGVSVSPPSVESSHGMTSRELHRAWRPRPC